MHWSQYSTILLQTQSLLNYFLSQYVLVCSTVFEIFIVIVAFISSMVIGKYSKPHLEELLKNIPEGVLFRTTLHREILKQLRTIYLIILLLALDLLATAVGYNYFFVQPMASLLTAWTVSRLVSFSIQNTVIARVIQCIVWLLVTLDLFDMFEQSLKLIDGIKLLHSKISLLSVIHGLFMLIFILFLGKIVLAILQFKFSASSKVDTSIQVLTLKITKMLITVTAIIGSLHVVGFEMSFFEYFSGMLGLGIGMGLKHVLSNHLSGMIILLDKAIKPGDVIQIGDQFGWINSLNGRYVAVRTRDGKELIIPNDEFITKNVVNWSHSDEIIRIHLKINVSYSSEITKAMDLMVKAAKETQRVLQEPEPVCRIIDFADSSIVIDLRFWINDPQNGVMNVKSDVSLKVLALFAAHSVEIPYPRVDVNIRSSEMPTGVPPDELQRQFGESGYQVLDQRSRTGR